MTSFTERELVKKYQSIPIMFKTYPGGKFTEGIVKAPISKVAISY